MSVKNCGYRNSVWVMCYHLLSFSPWISEFISIDIINALIDKQSFIMAKIEDTQLLSTQIQLNSQWNKVRNVRTQTKKTEQNLFHFTSKTLIHIQCVSIHSSNIHATQYLRMCVSVYWLWLSLPSIWKQQRMYVTVIWHANHAVFFSCNCCFWWNREQTQMCCCCFFFFSFLFVRSHFMSVIIIVYAGE